MLTFLVLVGGVAVAVPEPAFAACSGSSCNGKDPNAQGCSAVNVGATEVWRPIFQGSIVFNFSVAMRYSSGCQARWTRIVIDDYEPTCCIPLNVSIERQLWTPYGYARTHYYTKRVPAGNEGQFWTLMTQNSSDDRHRSCYGEGSGAVDWICSEWIY